MTVQEFIDSDDRYNNEQSDEDILYEMSNFKSRVTGLPLNIELWVRTDPVNHGHNRYRVKILKDKQWAAIYLVGQNPICIKDINQTITAADSKSILDFISTFSALLISLIDDKIDTGEFEYEVKKHRGLTV